MRVVRHCVTQPRLQMQALLLASAIVLGSNQAFAQDCLTIRPGDGWTCVNGGWLPPGYTGSVPSPPPPTPPPAPPPQASSCVTPVPAPGWICVSGGWLPPNHPAIPVAPPPPPPPAPVDPDALKIAALEARIAELQASRGEFETLLQLERQNHSRTLNELTELQNPSSCQGGYVALTFDDGPNAETIRKLDALRAARLKATFFVLGQQVLQHPDIARRIVAEGHDIGNHSLTHTSFATLTAEAIDREIQQTQQIVFEVTGYTPKFVRPPYGDTNALVKERIKAAGLTEVLWTNDTFDWLPYTVRELSAADGTLIPGNELWIGRFRTWDAVLNAVVHVQPNGIVLMHDALASSTEMIPHLSNYWTSALQPTPICSGRLVPTTNVMPNQNWWHPSQRMHVKAGPWN